MWTAFPPSDYYEDSAPCRADHRPPRSSRAILRERTRQGSQVHL